MILAAAAQIEESGSYDVSVAKVARLVGVSGAASYRYFKDKDDLLIAVRELALWHLHVTIEDLPVNEFMTSRERVITLCLAYFDFIQCHGAFFDLLWGSRLLRAQSGYESHSEYRLLRPLILAIEHWRADISSDTDTRTLATILWSLVRGLSAVTISSPLSTLENTRDIRQSLRSTAELFLDNGAQGVEHGFFVSSDQQIPIASMAQ